MFEIVISFSFQVSIYPSKNTTYMIISRSLSIISNDWKTGCDKHNICMQITARGKIPMLWKN